MKNFLEGFFIGMVLAACYVVLAPSYNMEIKSTTVAPGDTVWAIATYYMDEQNKHSDVRGMEYDILKANKLSYNSSLQPGQTLYIPLYKKVK